MNILIVKTSALGDVIHAFPVVAYLRKAFPEAQIDWVVEEQSADVVRSHPYIDRTLVIKTQKWRKSLLSSQTRREIKDFTEKLRERNYTCVLDLQGNIKSGIVTALAKSKHKVGFGRKTVPEWPNTFFTNARYNPPPGRNIREDYLYLAQAFFKDDEPIDNSTVNLKITAEQQAQIAKLLSSPVLQQKPKVMICPGSAWPNKQMTNEALLELLQRLQPHLRCSFLLVWGSQAERAIAEQLHQSFPNCSVVPERLPLPVLQNLMGRVDMVIAMDSLPLHLAGTTATKVFGVFGASSAEKYRPLNSGFIQGPCPYGRTFDKRCPILRTCPTGLCIRGLSGDSVFDAISTVKCPKGS